MSSSAVSVVILCWKSQDYIGPCLRSVAASSIASQLDVVVVDNASGDNALAVATGVDSECGHPFARFTVLPLETNRGCCGGNNAGWRAADSSAATVVFLNPDTEVTPDCIQALTDRLAAEDDIGIVGAKIYYPGTRTLQHAGGFIYANGMTGHYGAGEDDHGQHDVRRDVGYVTGAGFAVRRTLLERLGGFDEDYFPAYFEETDLCARAWRAGFRVVYEPTSLLYHHESVSLTANSPGFRRLYQRMRIRYLLKNLRIRGLIKAAWFEARWMLFEPAARGYRREQFRAYAEGLQWWFGRFFRRRRGESAP